jgi:hypothetical protein
VRPCFESRTWRLTTITAVILGSFLSDQYPFLLRHFTSHATESVHLEKRRSTKYKQSNKLLIKNYLARQQISSGSSVRELSDKSRWVSSNNCNKSVGNFRSALPERWRDLSFGNRVSIFRFPSLSRLRPKCSSWTCMKVGRVSGRQFRPSPLRSKRGTRDSSCVACNFKRTVANNTNLIQGAESLLGSWQLVIRQLGLWTRILSWAMETNKTLRFA